MKAQISQQISDSGREKIKKEGHVKALRSVEYELFGPDSPLSEKVRVFLFIKYRIQDNKRESESERMRREFIVRTTGISPGNFNRIVNALEIEDLIEIDRTGTYRDSAWTYRLSRKRFTGSVIAPDLRKDRILKIVDNFENDGDKSEDSKPENFNSKLEDEPKLQNELPKLQSEVESSASTTESFEVFSLRSLSLRSLKLNPRSLQKKLEESFTLKGKSEAEIQAEGRAKFLRDRDLLASISVTEAQAEGRARCTSLSAGK